MKESVVAISSNARESEKFDEKCKFFYRPSKSSNCHFVDSFLADRFVVLTDIAIATYQTLELDHTN